MKDLHSGMRAYRKSLINELDYEPAGAALPVETAPPPNQNEKTFKGSQY